MKTLLFYHRLLPGILVFFLTANPGMLTGQYPAASFTAGTTQHVVGAHPDADSKQSSEWILYTRDHTGIPYHTIWHVLVDDYGHIWLGTDNGGLVRFDGEVWTVFDKENSWLPGNMIMSLAKDHYGNLWIGTSGVYGLTKFNGTEWRTYLPANSRLPDEGITSIAFDSKNAMWFSTNKGSLVKVEGLSVSNEPVWTFYEGEDYDPIYNNHPGNYITQLVIDTADHLWMGTLQSGLVHFDGTSFENYGMPASCGNGVLDLVLDHNQQLWVGDRNGDLLKFDGTGWELMEPDIPEPPEPPYLVYESIVSLAIAPDNALWVVTDGGLIRFDGSEWSAHLECNAFSSTIGFSEGMVLWAGAGNDLISYDIVNPFSAVYNTFNTGLPGDDVVAVRTDNSGHIWTGDRYTGLALFDGIIWKVFHEGNSGLPDSRITSVETDDCNNVWVGTQGGLAVKQAIALPGQEWIVFNSGNSDLPANGIHCLYFGNGTLWVGTSLGLTRFHEETWATFNTGNSDLPHNDVRCIVTDKDNNIWVGTNGGGLVRIAGLSLNEPDWQVFSTANSSLPDNKIFALEADSAGNLWIGTAYNGLVKYNNAEFTVYHTGNSGIPDDHIQSLTLEKDTTIWIGMRYGRVAAFNGADWTVFNSENSVLSGDCAIYAMDVDMFGNVWIGVDGGGVAVYNAEGVVCGKDLALSGKIFHESGESPLEESVIELYRLGENEYTARLELSGTHEYLFEGVEHGQYTLKVIPDTLNYPHTLPTWFGYKLARADAFYISMNKNLTEQNVTVIQRPPAGTGTGTVTGSIRENAGVKKYSTGWVPGAKNGSPPEGCYVFLLDPESRSPAAFDITNAEGEFCFSKLMAGQYLFYADYRGLPMSISNPLLEVGEGNDSLHIEAVAGIETIGIEVEVISFLESVPGGNLKAWPVPVNDMLNIHNGKGRAGTIRHIRIIDMNGKVQFDSHRPLSSGSPLVIDMSRFMPGIYLLQIRTHDASRYMKIIKK